jgi:hypothetical protein
MVITLSFIGYKGLKNKYWGLTMMRFTHSYIEVDKVPGLKFYKKLGSGSGIGFSAFPNFSAYAFLGVWDNEQNANEFLEHSDLFSDYKSRSAEIWTIYMKSIRVHGSWSGQQPFVPEKVKPPGELIAVITRATIARKYLLRFWRKVPSASAPLKNHEGLITTFGIGEWPLTQMATFSIWKNEDALRSYAYQQPDHLNAIKLTRELNWYTEEMFARFRPYRSEGTWKEENPLEQYL